MRLEMSKRQAGRHPKAGRKTESKGQGHMELRAKFWKAPGEGSGIAKAKRDESPWIKKGGTPSPSKLFSGLLCTSLPDGSHALCYQGS